MESDEETRGRVGRNVHYWQIGLWIYFSDFIIVVVNLAKGYRFAAHANQYL